MEGGDFSGSESGSVDSRGGTPGGEDGSKASGSRKRHASSNHISRPASAADNHSSFSSSMNQVNSFGNGAGASRLPYGFNTFQGGAFPQTGLANGQFPIAGLLNNSAFPNMVAGGSPRPEDVLHFQQQLQAHQQQQLAAFASSGNGNALASSGMYPSSLMNHLPSNLPGSPISSNSPYASQYQQQLAASQQAFNLMQQPERPLSSNSHHGDFSHQQLQRQPSSQHSSPLANGFPPYPGQQVSTPGSMNGSFNPPSRSGTPSYGQQGMRQAGTPSGRIEIGSAQAYSVMDRLKACCKLDDQAVSSDPGLLAFCNDVSTTTLRA